MRSHTHLSLFFLIAASFAASADPLLTFEPQAIVARVTPGASTAWFGVASESGAYTPRTVEYATILADSDNDGVVRFELNGPKPISIWLVVDMSNGQRTIGAPVGVVVRRTTLPPSALKSRGKNAQPGLILDEDALAVCWMVRPGAGAWRMVTNDAGGAHYDGRQNGKANFELRRLRAIDKSPDPPEDFAHGDIVVTVALSDLAVADVRVDQGR
jgi:hypothetical protein